MNACMVRKMNKGTGYPPCRTRTSFVFREPHDRQSGKSSLRFQRDVHSSTVMIWVGGEGCSHQTGTGPQENRSLDFYFYFGTSV